MVRKELLPFVDNVLPKTVCAEYPLEATSKSQSGFGFKGANGSSTMGSDVFESRQAMEAT